MYALLKKPIIIIPVLGVLIFVIFYDHIENFFVFHPDRDLELRPEQFGLAYEAVSFSAADGTRLHGWFFPLPGDQPVILFCHGNAGNISHRLGNIQKLVQKGFEVFIFDYRGYGKSDGTPSRQGIYQDGLAAYDHLVQGRDIRPERIVLFGRSLGAAVAIEIAVQKAAKRLILESAFTSTKAMARTMPLFLPISPFLPAHYDNLKKIQRVTPPKLFIHGDRDNIIPFKMGRELFEAANMPKEFYAVKGAGHNDTWIVGGEAYFKTIKRFTAP